MTRVFRPQVVRRGLLGAVIVLAAIQFVPVDRSNPPVETEVPVPATVRSVLRRACYDCHSHETVWPWYSRVAPFSWLVERDVREGRKELNFSAWNRLDAKRKARKMKETWKEVSEGEMPPWFYTAVHRDAALSSADRAALRDWSLGPTSEPGKESGR